MLEIDLVLENGKNSTNVFYQEKWFKNIVFQPGFTDVWNRKKLTYDLILNLTQTPFSLLYYYFTKGKHKENLHWVKRKKLGMANDYDLESALAKKISYKISDNDSIPSMLPTINIEREKLDNTEKLIDWLLQSENLKPLSFSNYVFLYLDKNQETLMLEGIEKMIYAVLNQKKFKVLVVLEKGSKSKEEQPLMQRLKKIEDTNFFLNFIEYNDLYYLVKFAEKTILSITDSHYLNTIGEVKNWRVLYLDKKTLNRSEMNRAIERVNYHLKNL